MSTRTESDAFGPIEVSNDVLWGAQTQRSLQNFPIGGPAATMPAPVIRAFGILKKCAAQYNVDPSLITLEAVRASSRRARALQSGGLELTITIATSDESSLCS